MKFLLTLVLLLVPLSTSGCCSTETDPEKIMLDVSDFEPPMLRYLEEMSVAGIDTAAEQLIFSVPGMVSASDLEPLTAKLVAFKAMTGEPGVDINELEALQIDTWIELLTNFQGDDSTIDDLIDLIPVPETD